MNPESGRRFGPYEIQSRLGGGGMGHVFRAWDARLHREVAIKLLNHEYAMPGMRERFLREARAASALNHPNICSIFDIGEQDGDPYLVMELLEGQTLKDRIRGPTMQLDEIISIARDSAEGLGAAHAKGVVHRDVKPANIFLVNKPNGATQAKILDFGLAKIEGGLAGMRGRSLEITTVGATVGTLAYMSPEQARGEPLDARSDLFSLGVVMYEMATRQVPFQGATSALVFVQLLNHPPEPVREWNDAVPRDLEKIIFKLLAKERTARFQTARELELALIALTEKGSGGGWLRKAVANVPLVRSNDPIARGKRMTRAQASSDPGLQAPPRPITPFPAANFATGEETSTNGNATGPALRPSGASDQVLRPVARIPRNDDSSGDNPLKAENVESTNLSPIPPSPLPSGGLTPSKRLAQIRLNSAVADAEAQPIRSATPVPPSASDPVRPARTSSGGRARSLRSPFTFKTVAMASVVEPIAAPSDEQAIRSSELDAAFPSLFTADSGRSRWNLPSTPRWLALAGIALLFGCCVLFVYLNHTRFAAAPLKRSDVVVLTEIENHTGDKNLDNSITEALRFDLAQSSYFVLRSGESYQAALRLVGRAASGADGGTVSGGSVLLARKAAERLGAKAYLFGSISGNSAPYTLHVELRSLTSNDVLATAESHPESLQQVASAIDQVATELRVAAGEPRVSVDANSKPLASEASSNLAAVELYAEAESLLPARQPLSALADLQKAVSLDPNFIQAHIRLALLYQRLRAETAAAESARLALSASAHAGERTRTLTQALFEREATGDYPHATALLRQVINTYPHDTLALVLLADSLRLQGHMAEALTYAQQAYTDDPFSAAAYSQAEIALIGLDRYDAAYQLDLQAQRLNLARPADSLAAADLDERQDVVSGLMANLPVGKMEYRPDWAYGIYLDNAGRLAAAATLWRNRAEAAQQNDNLKSAGNFLLAQGAIDRALLGDCAEASAMLPADSNSDDALMGRSALFNTAVTSALCGDQARAVRIAAELRQRFPQSFEVNAYFLADIQAAEDLHDGRPGAALSDLVSARAFDLISITPLLRGWAHIAENETAVGLVDFQTELSHRGVIYIVGGDVYPASQIGVARAFAKSGDLTNSAAAYRRFLLLWSNADPGNPLVNEAKSHLGS